MRNNADYWAKVVPLRAQKFAKITLREMAQILYRKIRQSSKFYVDSIMSSLNPTSFLGSLSQDGSNMGTVQGDTLV